MPISSSAMDLISKLLQSDPGRRLTAEETLNHPWLKGDTASTTLLDPVVINGLRTFDAQMKMKQAVLRLMIDTLSNDEIDALKKTFSSMDLDHDGNITLCELQSAMKLAVGAEAAQVAEIETILKKADLDGNGSLSYDELMLSFVHRKLTAKEERLWTAFCKFDLDGDGRITMDELEQVLKSHGFTSKSDIVKMLTEADSNHDGTIDFEEFLAMMWTDKQDGEHKSRNDHKDDEHHVHPTARASSTSSSSSLKVLPQLAVSSQPALGAQSSTDQLAAADPPKVCCGSVDRS